MDYGHTMQDREKELERLRTVNSGDMLSPTNGVWDVSPDRDPRNIGGSAISSADALESPLNTPNQSSELGQVVSLDMPPGATQEEATSGASPTDDSANNGINLNHFVAENDRISTKTLEVTGKAVNDFEKGKITPAEFDDRRWEAAKAYMENSFGRKVGE